MRKHRLFRLRAPLLGVSLSACGALAGGAEIHTAPAPAYAAEQTRSVPVYAALPEDSVEVHAPSEPVPDSAIPVAQFTVPDSMVSHTDEQVIASYRPQAARLGATWIVLDPAGGQRRVVAYHLPASVRIRRIARDSEPHPAASSAPASSSGSGPVHVRGYRRRDGTYVRPHTRSPRRRGHRATDRGCRGTARMNSISAFLPLSG